MSDRLGSPAERPILFGPFRLIASQRLLVEGGTALRLGSRALDVLVVLLDRHGDVVSKEELIARVWPGTVVDEGNLKVQVAALRRALRDGSGGSRYIKTVPGRGYCFVAPVTVEATEAAAEATEAVAWRAGPTKSANNLPARLTRLIGRAAVVERLAAQSPHVRLLTIVGPGGIGKTSVALAIAEELTASYDNGVWLVDLAPIGDANLVPSALATVLGLEIRTGNPLPGLIGALRDRRMLIVLDNCAHVIDVAAHLAAAIMRGAPGVHILATSREPLRVQGEHLHRLSTLESPPATSLLTAAEAMSFPAIELFVERATESSDDFTLDDADIPALAEICRKLDGIPLAIEFAAARVGALGVRGLASHLHDRLRLLTYGRRADLARHRTMRATLDWSYSLLNEMEQLALRRVAIFAGRFTLQAAAAVGGDPEVASDEIDDQVQALVAKSLVVADVAGAEPRYRLLETTRAYLLEKLGDSGELDAIAQRHAAYYRDMLAAAGAAQGAAIADAWRDTFAAEIDNVRAALAWAFSSAGNAATAVALAAASAPLWIEMSLLTECCGWMEAAVARLGDAAAVGTRHEMIVQTAFGLSLMDSQGRAATARTAISRGSELAEMYQDVDYQLRTLVALALFCIRLEEFDGALGIAHRIETLAKGIHDAAAMSKVDCIIGLSLFFLGNYAEAVPYTRRAYLHIQPSERLAQIARSGMDYSILARCVEAQILWLQGHVDQSARASGDVLADAEAGGHPASICQALTWCGCGIPLRLGDLDTAERSVARLKDYAGTNGFGSYYAMGLGHEGNLRAARGDIVVGERLLRACLNGLHSAQYESVYTSFLGSLSEVLALAGDFDGSLATVDEVLRRIENNHGFWWKPEALRIKGKILLLPDKADTTAAEEQFRRSLDLARRQGSLSWELRSTTSLARIWRKAGRSREARELLMSVYDRFTEGFETADLKSAKLLLDGDD